MSSYLRNLLFRLLSGLNALALLKKNSLQINELQDPIEELISFLDQVQYGAQKYLTSKDLDENEMGVAFTYFLTALSLTKDQRLSNGPAYAVSNVALDSSIWSKVVGNFNEEQERKVVHQLNEWISFLKKFLVSNELDGAEVKIIDQMYYSFEQTVSLLEQAMVE